MQEMLEREVCRHTIFADGTHNMMADDTLHLYSLLVSFNGHDIGVPVAHFITTSKDAASYEWFLRAVRDNSPLLNHYPVEFRTDMELAFENGISGFLVLLKLPLTRMTVSSCLRSVQSRHRSPRPSRDVLFLPCHAGYTTTTATNCGV